METMTFGFLVGIFTLLACILSQLVKIENAIWVTNSTRHD